MVLVHHQRHMGIGFNRGLNQVLDEGLARVFACTRTGLQDDRRADLIGCRHHSLHLL